MKKFYAFVAAALMSVSLFAQAPSQSDIASYAKDGHYVACFGTPEDATCNDIVWVGEYNSWNLQDEDIIVCEELAAFPGWYVAVVPVVEGKNNDGKPVQINECGKRNWDWQCGTVEAVAGTVEIKPNGAECDLKGWSVTDPGIVKVTAWKNGVNPCTATCQTFTMTVRVYPPYCEDNEELEPTLKGSWNWDADAITMEFKGSYFEAAIPDVPLNVNFKFNNDAAGSWDNQFEYRIPEDEDNDIPEKWVQFNNFNLDPEDAQAKFYTREGNTLIFDFSDTDNFRYASCGAEPVVPEEPEQVVVGFQLPDPVPAAGVEIIGTFDGWKGTALELSQGMYMGLVEAKPSDYFKIREAGTWSNELLIADAEAESGWRTIGDGELVFGELWQDGADVDASLAGLKVIALNLSSLKWSVDPSQGIENIVLTEKAQKVMVDGVLYIVRDNKMFNVTGTQVR